MSLEFYYALFAPIS